MGITHGFTSTKSDGGDATLVTPSDWNAAHAIDSVAPSGLTGATAASRYVGATASGAPASGTFSTGDYIVDQSGKIWVCTTGGSPGTWAQVGGKVFDGKPFIWTPPASPATQDDEFSDYATGQSGPSNGLDAKWSKHNLVTGTTLTLSDSVAPSCLVFDLTSGSDQGEYLSQTAPSGDFSITCGFHVLSFVQRQMWGLGILDSSGNGVSLIVDLGSTQDALRGVTTYIQNGSTTNTNQSSSTAATAGTPIYMRLRKASGVYWGAIWQGSRQVAPNASAEVSMTPSAFTVATVGFGRFFWASGGLAVVALDFFRKS